MIERLGKAFAYVFVIVGIPALLYLIFRGIQEEPSIVGSLATALAAVLAVLYGQQRQAKAEQQQAHRQKLEPLYAELIDRYRGNYEKDQVAEGAKFFGEFVTPLLMSGSDGVTKAWVEFQRVSAKVDLEVHPVHMGQMLPWEEVMKAIRKDLGHSGSGLESGDLLCVYVNDIDDGLPNRP